MEKQLEVLNQIYENENITQREISEKTGLSLGAVNILIKKMIRTGFIKMEKLNARTLRYVLTPQGMKEKTTKTYQYIVDSLEMINHIRAVLSILLERQYNAKVKRIYLYGAKDEVYKVIVRTLEEISKEWKIEYAYIQSIDEIGKDESYNVFIWGMKAEKEVKEAKVPYVNILTHI